MPDSIKLLLRDAIYLGFHTDCLWKSIDWRFLYQNFIKIGQVVWILQVYEVKTNFLSTTEFSMKIVKESIFKFLSFLNSLSWEHVNGLEWKKYLMQFHKFVKSSFIQNWSCVSSSKYCKIREWVTRPYTLRPIVKVGGNSLAEYVLYCDICWKVVVIPIQMHIV